MQEDVQKTAQKIVMASDFFKSLRNRRLWMLGENV